jgi:hypothetical protein
MLAAIPRAGMGQEIARDSLDGGLKYKAFDFKDGSAFNGEPVVIRNAGEYKKLLEETPYKVELLIDFEKNTLVCFSYAGTDCHSTFRFKLERDDINKQFVYNVYIFYGGCRAGGHNFDRWSVIPKLPDDYSFTVKSHRINE